MEKGRPTGNRPPLFWDSSCGHYFHRDTLGLANLDIPTSGQEISAPACAFQGFALNMPIPGHLAECVVGGGAATFSFPVLVDFLGGGILVLLDEAEDGFFGGDFEFLPLSATAFYARGSGSGGSLGRPAAARGCGESGSKRGMYLAENLIDAGDPSFEFRAFVQKLLDASS